MANTEQHGPFWERTPLFATGVTLAILGVHYLIDFSFLRIVLIMACSVTLSFEGQRLGLYYAERSQEESSPQRPILGTLLLASMLILIVTNAYVAIGRGLLSMAALSLASIAITALSFGYGRWFGSTLTVNTSSQENPVVPSDGG